MSWAESWMPRQQGSEVPFQQHAQRQDYGYADYEDLQHLVDTLHGFVPEQVGIAGDGVQRGYELVDQAGPDDDKVDIECLGNEGSPVLAGIEQRQGDEKSHRRYQMENVVQDLAPAVSDGKCCAGPCLRSDSCPT